MSLHNRLKPFTLDIETSDSSVFVKSQDTFIKTIETDMRDNGYVPVLDLNPYITGDIDIDSNTFRYKITIHGMYVGRKKAWETQGWAMGKLLPISTQARKSKPSSATSD